MTHQRDIISAVGRTVKDSLHALLLPPFLLFFDKAQV